MKETKKNNKLNLDEIVKIGSVRFERAKYYTEEFIVYVEDRTGERFPNIESAKAAYDRACKRGRIASIRRVVTQYWDIKL